MGDVVRVVTDHYPVDKLPEELRHGLEAGQAVRVTVELETFGMEAPQRSFRSFYASAPGLYASPEDAVAFIRALRDESDR